MRIAIHTLIGHRNYGCILQAYALQTTLEKEGHIVSIINRRENWPNNRLLFRRLLSVFKSILKRYILLDKKVMIGNPFDYFYSLRHIDASYLKNFTIKYLKYTKLFRSSKALTIFTKKNKFDAYIVGSDQVWREIYTPSITDSFLGYLAEDNKAIRISYAVSFGTKDSPISKEKLPECIELAKRFKAISVREKSGVHIMKESFGIDATHVLDPTLLLDYNDYSCFIQGNSIGKSKVVSYILDKTEEKSMIVDEVSTTFNVNCLELMDYPINNDGVRQQYSVEDWLSAIHNAKFVVTDSFHGCVFSIIFNKPFIVIANIDRGFERFISILGTFGLEDRMVESYDDFVIKKNDSLSDIDYKRVNDLLFIERIKSRSYLFENLI